MEEIYANIVYHKPVPVTEFKSTWLFYLRIPSPISINSLFSILA